MYGLEKKWSKQSDMMKEIESKKVEQALTEKEKLVEDLTKAKKRLSEIELAKLDLVNEEYQVAHQKEVLEKELKEKYPEPGFHPEPPRGTTISLEGQNRIRERAEELTAMRPIHAMIGAGQSGGGNYKLSDAEFAAEQERIARERERLKAKYPEGTDEAKKQVTAAEGVPGIARVGGVDWREPNEYR